PGALRLAIGSGAATAVRTVRQHYASRCGPAQPSAMTLARASLSSSTLITPRRCRSSSSASRSSMVLPGGGSGSRSLSRPCDALPVTPLPAPNGVTPAGAKARGTDEDPADAQDDDEHGERDPPSRRAISCRHGEPPGVGGSALAGASLRSRSTVRLVPKTAVT